MLYSNTVRLILESLGRSEEVEFYLKRFKSTNSSNFCILIPDYDTLNELWESFLFSIETLDKLELFAIIYVGGYESKNYFPKFQEHDFFYLTSHLDFLNKEIKKTIVFFDDNTFLKFYLNHQNQLPRRIHFVRGKGSIHDPNNQPYNQIQPLLIETINSYEKLHFKLYEVPDKVSENDIGIYAIASYLYQKVPDIHISITSSLMLLKELFTIKGSGTLLRKNSKIIHFKKQEITQEIITKAKSIIETSFQKRLLPDRLKNITDIIFDENFQSLIVLEQMEFGFYLSKFAVSIESRGKGIAQDLWNYLENQRLPLFWKTHISNFIKKWYEKISDGHTIVPNFPYVIFWKNISYTTIPQIIEYLIQRGSDFYE